MSSTVAALYAALSDEEIVARVLGGETALYEILMRRHNQRLYRAARAILRDENEAEDVMQEAYVRAFQHLGQFAGEAKFSTWLTKIAIHEALARTRKRSRVETMDFEIESPARNPEQETLDSESHRLIEEAVDALPENYRTVFMLREVEGLSTAETAAALGIAQETAKTRLHRARGLLRRHLYRRLGTAAHDAFPFGATRCDRVVAAVFARISESL